MAAHGKNDVDLNKELVFNNGDCVENVDRFCYLGDVLNSGGGGGGVESASIMRVRCAWAKCREEVSLKLEGIVCATWIRSTMLYGSETWAMNVEQMTRFDRTEMRMVRWMSGVSMRDHCSNASLRENGNRISE